MKKLVFLLLMFLSCDICHINGEQIVIEPLFTYPTAPDNLSTMEERCDYLVANFWNSFDFKNNNTVDQNALNDAFNVYAVSIGFANRKKTLNEIDKLISKFSKNPILTTQFLKAAEENLYGSRAVLFDDEIYIKFLDAFVKNKKIDSKRKTKYVNQLTALTNSRIGNKMHEFSFKNAVGKEILYFPMSTPTLLIFCDPDNSDWRLMRLKMETNSRLSDYLDKGLVNVIFIVNSDRFNWEILTSNYPKKWTVGANPEVADIIDTRFQPMFYVIGKNGNILYKNMDSEISVEQLLEVTTN